LHGHSFRQDEDRLSPERRCLKRADSGRLAIRDAMARMRSFTQRVWGGKGPVRDRRAIDSSMAKMRTRVLPPVDSRVRHHAERSGVRSGSILVPLRA
jgi:hypothetical protein